MTGTIKNKTNKHNITKKHKNQLTMCPIGLKPFEENFTKKYLKIN